MTNVNQTKKKINENVKYYDDGIGENSPEEYKNIEDANLTGTGKKTKKDNSK